MRKKIVQHFTSWGNYPVSRACLIRPEKIGQLGSPSESILDGITIVRGMGRSGGDAALNGLGNVLLFERLNRMLSFNETTGVLRAEAGLTLADIVETFVPKGWFIPVTPGTKWVTLGGCLAADIYGKNHFADGSFSNFINGFQLMLADGTSRFVTREGEPDLFIATLSGMGLTGIITEVELKLTPIESAYMRVQKEACKDFDHLWDKISNPRSDAPYVEAWIDVLARGKDFGRSTITSGRHALLKELPKYIQDPFSFQRKQQWILPFYLPSMASNVALKMASFFNTLYYKAQSKKAAPFLVDYDTYFYSIDRIWQSQRFFGKRGFIQYQVLIPANRAKEGLKTLLYRLQQERLNITSASLQRLGEEGEGLLSFPCPGYTLGVNIPIGPPKLFSVLEEIDYMVADLGGRVYLAKDARMSPDNFRRMYRNADRWSAIKQEIDPKGLFSSDLASRLKMGVS